MSRRKLLVLLVVLAVQAPSVASASVSPPIRGMRSYVYVDLSQQRLYEVHRFRVTLVLHVSTGGGYRYRSANGVVRIAATPVGRFSIRRKAAGWQTGYLWSMYYPSCFSIGRKAAGWQTGYLWSMYYPSYFYGGYAIHGSTSVPWYPASHG